MPIVRAGSGASSAVGGAWLRSSQVPAPLTQSVAQLPAAYNWPLITSADSVSVTEGAQLAHTLIAPQAVTWSIVGGADQAELEVSGSTLRWASNGTKTYAAVSLGFTGGTLPAGVTFARAAGPATYTDSGGVMQLVTAADVARFDYDPVTHAPRGLLIEPASTNLLVNSAVLGGLATDQASWSSNSIAAPDGTTSADRLVENAANSRHIGYQQLEGLSAGSPYTQSVYAKPAGRDYLALNTAFGTSYQRVFNLASGASGSAASSGSPTGTASSLSNGGGGFYRPSVSINADSTSMYFIAALSDADPPGATVSGNPSYAGNGSSGVDLWGWQIEAGSVATSYIPTSGSAATRAADNLSFTVPAGVTGLRYTFDDNSTQDVDVSAGTYAVPTNLNGTRIKGIADTGNTFSVRVRATTAAGSYSEQDIVVSLARRPATYKGARARSSAYLGAKTDSQIYLGANQLGWA